MSGWIFDAPGGLKDFHNPNDWHAAMLREARDIIMILVGASLGKDPIAVTDADIAQERDKLAYADPTQSPLPAGAETVPIQAWNGFPRAVQRRAPLESAVDGGVNRQEARGSATTCCGCGL